MHGSSAAPQLLDLCTLPVKLIFKKHFFTRVLVYFYLVVTTVNSVACEIICWIPVIDCGYPSLFFIPLFLITIWYWFWFFFTVVKMSLDCALIEDKELKAAEAFYLLWRLHPEKYEGHGLQFSSFLPHLHISEPSLHPLGNSCHQLSPNFFLKGKSKYPNRSWGSTASEVAVRYFCPSYLRWAAFPFDAPGYIHTYYQSSFLNPEY